MVEGHGERVLEGVGGVVVEPAAKGVGDGPLRWWGVWGWVGVG
jgi:hypothetical protein